MVGALDNEQTRGRFIETIAHELRTPLTALAGYEELLADQVLGPLSDSQRDVIERMRSVTQHLSVVIEELLAFSSLEAARATIRPTDFLAADLVRSTANTIEPLARQKRLTVTVDLPRAPVRLTTDVDKTRQILVSLVGNAVKFTSEGGVAITLEQRDGTCRFTVRDTGMGINRHDVSRLFQPFAQLDASLTRKHGGTGLGLYIAHCLAQLLGGHIEVDSEIGKGSAFTLVLPLERLPPA
jgi:signal transduction histidine kinase